MTDRNTQLHAAFAYWRDTCCIDSPVWICTKTLMESFDKCMDRTGLSECVGKDSFELMLDAYGYEKKLEDGETTWTKLVPFVPPFGGFYSLVDFPEIFSVSRDSDAPF